MMNKIKDHVYDLVLYLATKGPRKKGPGRKLLIVRIDEIGDYILWHNFLADLIAGYADSNTTFHFCGNQSWKKLFDQFEKKLVDDSLWIDKNLFKTKMAYRYRFLRRIYREGYDTVINPTFSRDKRNDDAIVMAAKAANRIGMHSNQETVRPYDKGYDRQLYTRLFDHPAKPLFEFYRNRLFTGFATGKQPATQSTAIDPSQLPVPPAGLPENFFVIFPGSRSPSRIWPTANYLQVADFLFKSFGWTAVVCGTLSDSVYTGPFVAQYKQPLVDLTGKTSLPDMLAVFSKAKCLLSVDTGSVHLAAAVQCTVFGIFNGSQYGRFAPYPVELANNFHAVYPDAVENELKEDPEAIKKYEFVVPVPYAAVSPEKLTAAISTYYKC
jgi:ADP-heptose:LPS heptosyltransferase